MGSGSSKSKTVPSSTAPSSTESSKEAPKPGGGTSSPPPRPTSETKESGSSCPSASLEIKPTPEPTAAESVSEQKHEGDGVSSPVSEPECVEGSAEPSSSSSKDAQARKAENQNDPGGGGEKDAGKVSLAAVLTPSDPPAAAASESNGEKPTGMGTSMATAVPTDKDSSKKEVKEKGKEGEEERLLLEESQAQGQLDTSLRAANALVRQEGLLKVVDKKVTRLSLRRALPHHICLRSLVTKMDNLQVLNMSDNEMGPQAVRLLCLALPPTSPVVSLSLAGNRTDTDTAESVGQLLAKGPPLEYLDVSSNYLGKDFFSRCAGQALKTNTSLRTLRAQSIGMVDPRVLLEGVQENSTLVELDLSNNQITDRQCLGSALSAVLKKAECSLQSLALAGCNMNGQGLTLLSEGLAANTSLQALNLNNNEFGSLQTLLAMVVAACCHPALTNLHLNDARLSDQALTDVAPPATSVPSHLEVLSLNSSNLTEEFWSKLAATFPGRLRCLMDVDVSNNSKLSAAVVDHLWTLSADDSSQSGLHKLTVAMNDMNDLSGKLTPARFPRLAYLNTRKLRFSPDAFCALAGLVVSATLPLTTLVLDGVKLSGKKGLATLLGNGSSSQLTALSLSGCSLNDNDLAPLAEALGSGFALHMLKLSANRLTDALVKNLADNLLKCKQHPLAVLDACENQITNAGAEDLCRLYSGKNQTSSLHSVNLATNAIGKTGILSLLSCVGGKSPLKCLYVNNQSASFLESDTEEVYVKVASVLGYTVKRTGETIQSGCSDLPSLPNGLTINLRGLGGHAGELGPFLDCPAIVTDASSQRLMTLTFENVLDICAGLQGQKGEAPCAVSKEDWVHICGSDKDNSIPSWLQLADCRSKGVYLSNLPGNSTAQRLEALFETEADCNIEEVFLVKDPVTKNNSGTAWVLFSDQPSVDRAMELYYGGQAQVFGTPFTVSRIQLNVEESASSQASDKARQDVAARQRARAAEDRAHRQLIQQNTEESWKRHAYRLAHPAYADGRIW